MFIMYIEEQFVVFVSGGGTIIKADAGLELTC